MSDYYFHPSPSPAYDNGVFLAGRDSNGVRYPTSEFGSNGGIIADEFEPSLCRYSAYGKSKKTARVTGEPPAEYTQWGLSELPSSVVTGCRVKHESGLYWTPLEASFNSTVENSEGFPFCPFAKVFGNAFGPRVVLEDYNPTGATEDTRNMLIGVARSEIDGRLLLHIAVDTRVQIGDDVLDDSTITVEWWDDVLKPSEIQAREGTVAYRFETWVATYPLEAWVPTETPAFIELGVDLSSGSPVVEVRADENQLLVIEPFQDSFSLDPQAIRGGSSIEYVFPSQSSSLYPDGVSLWDAYTGFDSDFLGDIQTALYKATDLTLPARPTAKETYAVASLNLTAGQSPTEVIYNGEYEAVGTQPSGDFLASSYHHRAPFGPMTVGYTYDLDFEIGGTILINSSVSSTDDRIDVLPEGFTNTPPDQASTFSVEMSNLQGPGSGGADVELENFFRVDAYKTDPSDGTVYEPPVNDYVCDLQTTLAAFVAPAESGEGDIAYRLRRTRVTDIVRRLIETIQSDSTEVTRYQEPILANGFKIVNLAEPVDLNDLIRYEDLP